MTALFGEKVALHQERGPDVELRVFGDEFYARYETDDGYTAVLDPALGLFSYADLENGEFVSTGVPVTAGPPAGLAKRLTEAPDVKTAKAARRRATMGFDPES
jgi:hypothetical protein